VSGQHRHWRAEYVFAASRTLEGDGFEVRRAIPAPKLDAVGPFIFLDHFGPVDLAPGAARGASVHPHAGIETITLLLEGGMIHKDSLGNASTMAPGEVQWLRAGRGVVHDEQPASALKDRGGRIHGVQLWLNMPASRKHDAPAYRHFTHADVPQLQQGPTSVRLISGEVQGRRGPIVSFGGPVLLHITVAEPATFELAGIEARELALYVMVGDVRLAPDEPWISAGSMVRLGGAGGTLRLEGAHAAELILCGGDPLDRPIVRYGPFVMNSKDDLGRAIVDFQTGRMGRIA